MKAYTGNWHAVFGVAAIMNFIVVAMAMFIVRPMRARSDRRPNDGPARLPWSLRKIRSS